MRLFLLVLAVLGISAFPFVSSWFTDSVIGMGPKRAQRQIEEYINSHPDKILAALQNYQMRTMQESSIARNKDLISQHSVEIHDLSYPHVGDNKNLPVIIELSSYLCAHCKSIEGDIKKFIAEYVEGDNQKAVYVFRSLYNSSMPESVLAARALLAVNKVDPTKAKDFHTAMLKHNSAYNNDYISSEVKRLGIDLDSFNKQLADEGLEKALKANLDLAMGLEISGTPTFIVEDQVIVGAQNTYAALSEAINKVKDEKKEK